MSGIGRRPTDAKATGQSEGDPAIAAPPVVEERTADTEPSDEVILDDPFATFTEWGEQVDEDDYAGL